MKPPAISVIIPHLNQPQFLVRCLESLGAQEFPVGEVEIIVVDNGSQQLPRDLCASRPYVRLLSEPTPGPGPARNRGIAEARASLLAFIDADCIADRRWLRSLYQALREGRASIVGGDVRIAYEAPSRLTALEAYESVFAYRQKMYIEKRGFSGTGNLAMTREAYEAVGPFAGIGVAEDRDWGQRAGRAGLAIGYVPDMVVFHPARRTMRELEVKWDRHISHDFERVKRSLAGRVKWLLLAGATAVSALPDTARVTTSSRIHGVWPRLQAIAVLFRIRAYRAGRMLGCLLSQRAVKASASWNRN